ncbi:MAG: insulinase family protein [Alphaproteobacteria bacterium]|nr:insulinase family protein [Alphaproteobacteria bacterium]MBU0797306.1 insulinase family protein [Alphaproteobacteria bacterium]MBU0888906.1 insulinase family protein [Alphaproteobacteria bacterium]MBU1813926.1 insulinase family protein [Alphaproteobacteria bacterium]
MTQVFSRFLLALLLVPLLALPARAIDIQRVTSPGGIEAWLVADPTNPIIALEVAFRGGSASEPAGKEGLASLATDLLTEGAGDLDSQAFQKRLADLSISLYFSSGRDSLQAGFRTLTENRDEAFSLMHLALTEPRFDEPAVARARSQMLVGLKRELERPGSIASRAFWSAAFPDHPYGSSPSGTPESVDGLTVADMQEFIGRRFARNNLLVGVVGDITPAELGERLDALFAGLPERANIPEVPEVQPSFAGDVMVIDRNIPQSTVLFGQRGVKRSDPDFFAVSILGEVIGGGFGSRLTEEIREKRGLAYSVYAGLASLDRGAMLIGNVGTANARVSESLDLVRQEWARLSEEGPTEEEMADAKAYLTGSFWLGLDNSSRIASTLVAIQREGLGIDYLDRRSAEIEAVTMADLKRVARDLFDAKALTFVVVGKPEGVTATRPAPGQDS